MSEIRILPPSVSVSLPNPRECDVASAFRTDVRFVRSDRLRRLVGFSSWICFYDRCHWCETVKEETGRIFKVSLF